MINRTEKSQLNETLTIETPANIEGGNTDSITSNDEAVVTGIQQNKREHSI